MGLVMSCSLCAALAGGCDDGAMHPGGSPDAGVAPDARTAPPDGNGGGGLVSNTPGVTVVDVGKPATPDAVLISANLAQRPSGGQEYVEWLGEFKNTGSTLKCQVRLRVTLQDAAGSTLVTFSPFAYGEPYMVSGLTVSIPCVRPGQIGSFYSNDFLPAAVDLSRVARITVAFSDTGATGVVAAPHAPQLGSHVAMSFGEYDVAGSMTGVGGPVYAISITAFARDATSLPIAYLFDAELDTLQPGAVLPFETIGTPQAFTDYRLFVDFIDGVKPAVAAAPAAPASPQARARFDLEMARRAAGEGARARAAQARAR